MSKNEKQNITQEAAKIIDSVGVEAGSEEFDNRALLSREEIEWRRLAKRAEGRTDKDLFPTVEDVNHLFHVEKMPIPQELKEQYPQHCFKWSAPDKLQRHLQDPVCPWYIVTKMTHPAFANSLLIGLNGAVQYHGENILMFSLRSRHEKRRWYGIANLGKKLKQYTDGEPTILKQDGKECAIIEPTEKAGGSTGVEMPG